MRKLTSFSALLLASLFLFAASSCNAPPKAAKAPPVPEYLSGREAFQKLYVAAHSVAGDVQPYRMESRYTKGSPILQGKSGLWHVDFASPSRKLSKTFTWSGLVGDDTPERGVSHGLDDPYNSGNTATHLFEAQILKIDTDEALKVAQQHGGEKLTQSDPNQPIFFVLDYDPGKSELMWHVIYGTGQYDAKLTVFVDASSGRFLHAEK
jgi:hypothetical protein